MTIPAMITQVLGICVIIAGMVISLSEEGAASSGEAGAAEAAGAAGAAQEGGQLHEQ